MKRRLHSGNVLKRARQIFWTWNVNNLLQRRIQNLAKQFRWHVLQKLFTAFRKLAVALKPYFSQFLLRSLFTRDMNWCTYNILMVFSTKHESLFMFSLGRVWTRTGSDKYAFITLTITVKSWCGGNLVRRRFKSYSECTEVCFNGHFRQWKSDLTDPAGNQT